jgi:hypothetical protein
VVGFAFSISAISAILAILSALLISVYPRKSAAEKPWLNAHG